MSVQARSFWALCQPLVLLTESGKMYIESRDGILYDDDMNVVEMDQIKNEEIYSDKSRRIAIGMLPKWLCGTIWERTGAPVRGVILQSVVCSVLILFDFEFLLQASVLINCITWCAELCSFLRLRYSEPDTRRPYMVPGGLKVAWLITVDKLILVLVLFVLVIRDNPYYVLITIGFLIFTMVYYWCYRKHQKKTGQTEQYLISEMSTMAGTTASNNEFMPT